MDSPPVNELILADGADRVLARRWHGALGRPFVPMPGYGPLMLHVDVLDNDESSAGRRAAELAADLERLAIAYLGGQARTQVLHLGAPAARWVP